MSLFDRNSFLPLFLIHFFNPFSCLSNVDISAPLSPLKCFTFSHSLPILLLFSHPVSPFSFSVSSLSLHLSWGCWYIQCVWIPFFQEISCQSRECLCPSWHIREMERGSKTERNTERFGCGIQKMPPFRSHIAKDKKRKRMLRATFTRVQQTEWV